MRISFHLYLFAWKDWITVSCLSKLKGWKWAKGYLYTLKKAWNQHFSHLLSLNLASHLFLKSSWSHQPCMVWWVLLIRHIHTCYNMSHDQLLNLKWATPKQGLKPIFGNWKVKHMRKQKSSLGECKEESSCTAISFK